MDDSRASIARAGLLIFLVIMGFMFYQAGVDQAARAATPENRVGSAKNALLAPPPTNTPTTYVYAAWLSACDPTAAQIGLYAATDATCHPSRAVALNWLQSQLTAYGVLAHGEYLERASHTPTTCLATIYNSASAPIGYLCADARGLYRADTLGKDLGARWSVWSQE
jgi:hypothetical protein